MRIAWKILLFVVVAAARRSSETQAHSSYGIITNEEKVHSVYN